VPSGSGLTFLMGSSDLEEGDEDNPMRFAASGAADAEYESNQSDEDLEETARRRKELTDRFVAGELSLGELVREIRRDSDDEEEDDEDEVAAAANSTEVSGRPLLDEMTSDDESGDDKEWIPASERKGKRPQSRRTSAANRMKKDLESKKLFEDDFSRVQRQQLSKKRGRGSGAGKSRKKRLDPALQGLMGEANLTYARGDKETAIRMCMEVIKQEPSAPEPYQTLSTLYEENGDQEKALQFAMLAAHLAPQDSEEWARLADMSLELDDMRQAVTCFRKAIDADVENVRYHLVRCDLLERLGEVRGALNGFKRLLAVLGEDKGAEYLNASREVARLLHAREDIEGARNVLATAFDRHPTFVGVEDVNLLLELMIILAQYHDALDVLCRHGGVKFAASNMSKDDLEKLDPEKQLEKFTAVALDPEQPVEIKSKLVVVLVHLKAKHLVIELREEILSLNSDEYGDLMLDVSEAFAANDFHVLAVDFLEKLVESHSFAEAEVWLKLGESLMAVNRLEDAEKAYKMVMEKAPSHLEARRTLSAILHRLGRPEEALRTLTQDEEAELLNPTLLFERCQLLLKEARMDEFALKAKLLLSRHFVHIRNREELYAVASAKKLSSKNKALSEVRSYMRRQPFAEEDEPAANFEQVTEISAEEEFELFQKLCDVLYERGRFAELQRVAFSALGSPHFGKKAEMVKDVEFLCLLASFYNGDSYHAYNCVRELVVKNPKNARVWNLFNLVVHRADDVRHNRFLMRLMSKNPDNVALGVLNGHNCLVAGTYKYSLGEYMSAFKQNPSDPLVVLMLGLTFTHMACQKFSAKKHSLVVQACAFLNQYLKLRGPCQESYYNLGRAMHQLGLLPAGLYYYKRALDVPAAVADAGQMLDLRREAAFNISLIYQSSGAEDLARMYVQKYIII